uniref:NRDE-2, necessary for RNA interference, domain containing n=1 Tax=Sinocyclocheilus grahami TaxID=75366 RepID=A0A672P4J7_SINGR
LSLCVTYVRLSEQKTARELKLLECVNCFSTEDALKTHQWATERGQAEAEEAAGTSRCNPTGLRGRNHIVMADRRREKKKKHKKKNRDNLESSGSESDTVYHSDLLQKENADKEEAQVRVSETFIWLDDLQTPTDSPFCIDRRADRANWEYKSLYRGDIARYKRKGGSCLGLDLRTQAVDWNDGGPEKKRVDKKPECNFCPSTCQLLQSDRVPALPTLFEGNAVSSDTYIKLSACTEEQGSSTQASVSLVNPLGIYDRGTSLWLEGKGQPEVKGDQQDVEAQGSSSTLLSAQVEEFNRKLRENPMDTQLWLDFVHFQVGLQRGKVSFDGEMKKMSLHAVLEKKLSIVDRAVESNPANVDLKLEKLRLCKELWEPTTLQKEWKKLVFIHPNSVPLWRKYLPFTQSHFSTFSVSKVNSVFGKCLSTLSAVQDGSMVSHPPLPGTQEDPLDIFLQQCHFLQQAGHTEKAVCLFQAFLHITFFNSDSVKDLPTRQQVQYTHKHKCIKTLFELWPADEDDDEEQDDSEIKDETWPKWKIWLDVEASREANHWLPWRPDKTKGQSEEDCEDPDRHVLFDDIGPSMICVDRPDLQLQLILSFLQFLGLPGPSGRFSTASSSNILLDDLAFLEEGPDPERPLTSHDLPMAGTCAGGHMTFLSDCRRQAGLCKAGEEFLLNPDNRGSLALWREYAHLEWLLGNLEEARKVFDTALGMGVTRDLNYPVLFNLCFLYAQLEVEQTLNSWTIPTSTAVYILTKLAEGAAYTPFAGQIKPVAILKARKTYEQALLSLSTGSSAEAPKKLHRMSSLVGCFGLFQYLTVGIDAADAVASLWHLYFQAENCYHRFFHSVAKKTNSVVPYIFAITAKQQLRQMLDSVQSNRIRCLFENAIATEHGAHCPLLWRMYLNFMVCDENAERGSGIFYKALQAVPWGQGLYMDTVQLFPERVQEFLDLMSEEELCLRVPMEEVDILLED